MSVIGILAGTEVEVASVTRTGSDLLVGLITTPPTWVFVRAGAAADGLEQLWAGTRRVAIPMPPQGCLMFEAPEDPS